MFNPALVKRRIEKRDIETQGREIDESYRIRAAKLQERLRLQALSVTLSNAASTCSELSAITHTSRAARTRLETQRPTSGKQIQAGTATQILAEPVEQRLAHTLRRSPQGR